MKTKLIYSIVLGTLFLWTCNDDEFLRETPHTPSDFSFYTSESGAEQGLTAAYDAMSHGETVERIELTGTVCSGDAMAGGEPGGNDQPPMQEIMKFQTVTSNNYVATYWRSMYQGIYRCNILLYYIQDGPLDDFDEVKRNRFIGEAKFLRALYHFKLMINYGGFPQLQAQFGGQLKGIPYIDEIVPQSEWFQERPALEETWTRIEEDFAAAAELLPVKSEYSSSNTGRATKGAALAMLAKTYLYQEKWKLAYETAKEVVNSNEYYLMGEDAMPGPFTVTRSFKTGEAPVQISGYKYIWQPEANNCPESILDVNHHMDANANEFPNNQEGNLVPQYYGVRAVLAYYYDPAIKDTAYGSIQVFWGFILPTQYFIQTAFHDIGCFIGDKIVDPRFKLSVISPTDSVPVWYDDPVFTAKYSDSAAFDPYFNNPATGYATWKYFTDPIFDQQRAGLGDRPQNTKYFRFADLLLIGAEAGLNVGGAAQNDALTWINRVRERARNSGNTGYPQDLTMGELTREAVWAERRVELAFEGHQFYDIIRTGRAEKVLKQDAMQYATSNNPAQAGPVYEQFGDNFQLGKSEILPIPQSEIDVTQGGLTQNPNYE
jgi:hypothetical protein